MKKIDNWLSIQRYVSEASSQTMVLPAIANVEVWGKVQPKRSERRTRRFLIPRISRI